MRMILHIYPRTVQLSVRFVTMRIGIENLPRTRLARQLLNVNIIPTLIAILREVAGNPSRTARVLATLRGAHKTVLIIIPARRNIHANPHPHQKAINGFIPEIFVMEHGVGIRVCGFLSEGIVHVVQGDGVRVLGIRMHRSDFVEEVLLEKGLAYMLDMTTTDCYSD